MIIHLNMTKSERIMYCMKKYMAIFVAVLFIMLCFGFKDTLDYVINNTLLYVTNFGRNAWRDWLFVVFTLLTGFFFYRNWLKNRKIISQRLVAALLVLGVLYSYYRFSDQSGYVFTCYWNGPIAYLDGFALIGLVLFVLWFVQQFQKKPDPSGLNNYSFCLDSPIENADADLFHMGSLVNRIVSFISFTDVSKGAFSMGIVGEWGDGKTSLMNLVEEKIKEDHKDFIIVHFNPRSSKKSDFIQENFLQSLKQALRPYYSGIDQTIDDYAIALDAIPGMPQFVAKMLAIFKVYIDKNRRTTRGKLNQAINEIGRRIVVFVDDLDRLTGDELLEVVKVLDTNGAFPNMVFLTSFDKNYVNTVLANHLNLGQQRRPYTDKYFTVEVHVPLHPSFRLLDYLVKQITDACKSGFITNPNENEIDRQTRQLSSLLMTRMLSIRDIKRFANQFLYDYAEVQNDVVFHDFLLLELIKFAYPNEYEGVYRMEFIHRGAAAFTSSSSSDLFYLNNSLLPKKSSNGSEFVEPENLPECIDILKRLFPEESGYRNWYAARYQRIYSVSSFEHYFYNYEYSHLKNDDIKSLFSTNDMKEACSLIDSWAPFSNDLETYFLTRSIESIQDKSVLKKYFQFLLYVGFKYPSYNYNIQSFSFLRKEDVDQIVSNCGFVSNEDYIVWLEECLNELTTINPLISSLFVRRPIKSLCEPDADANLFVVTADYLQGYALKILKDYLGRIDEEGWSADTAYLLSHIVYDVTEDILPAALVAIHDAMVSRFERFSSTLPFVVEQLGGCFAGFNTNLYFYVVFENDKDELGRIINSEKYNEAPEIQLCRAIWPLFKANGYRPVTLPKGTSSVTVKKTLLKDALKDLERYEQVGKTIQIISNDWNAGHEHAEVEYFIKRIEEVRNELQSIPLRLELSNTYERRIVELLDQFNEYAKKD